MDERKYTAEQTRPQIEQFLKPLIERAGLQVTFLVTEGDRPHPDFENPEVMVKFSGADVSLLLDNRAELLLSLEHLTMEVLRMPPEDHSRLCFDADDYRMLRVEELRLSAAVAAEKVKRIGVPFRFNPMTSRERRIIHLALREEPALRSESAGQGGQRQVVVYPANMPSPPQAPQQGAGERRPFGRPRR